MPRRVAGTVRVSLFIMITVTVPFLSCLGLQAPGGSSSQFFSSSPSDLFASVVDLETVILSWKDQAADETGYVVERKDADGGDFKLLSELKVDSTSYTDTGLNPDKTYLYRVGTKNFAGLISYSEPIEVTTGILKGEAPPQAPAKPTGLTATAKSQTEIILSWTDNSTDEKGFAIERRKEGSGTFKTVATTQEDTTSYTDSGLSPATTYLYAVRSLGAVASNQSNIAQATTKRPVPATPANLQASVSNDINIQLTWDNVEYEDNFIIQRKKSTGSWSNPNDVKEFTVAANRTSFTDSGLGLKTAYNHRISAKNTEGQSAWSPETSATTGQSHTYTVTGSTGGSSPSIQDVGSTETIGYTGSLKVAEFDGSSFTTTTVSSQSSVNKVRLVQVGTTLHLIYLTSTGKLEEYRKENGTWDTLATTIATGINDFDATATSSVVSLITQSGTVLDYRQYDTSWSSATSLGVTGSFPKIVYTTVGVWHVVYYFNSSELRHIKTSNPTGTWPTASTITTVGATNPEQSIAVDTSGNVHMSFYHQAKMKYLLYTHSSGSWGTEVIADSTDGPGRFSSIAVDGSTVHIVYYDQNGKLLYKFGSPPTEATSAIEIDSGTGTFMSEGRRPSLIRTTSTTHVAYRDDLQDLIEYYKRAD